MRTCRRFSTRRAPSTLAIPLDSLLWEYEWNVPTSGSRV